MKRIMLQSPLRMVASATTLVIVLLAIASFSGSASAWLISGRRPAVITRNPGKAFPKQQTTSTGSTESSTQLRAKERIGSEVITITRFGFETTEVNRPAGKFFLLIENRSGLNPITLRLKSERGEKVIEVTQPQDQLDWADELNLRPGQYTLTLAERPAWVCDITITTP